MNDAEDARPTASSRAFVRWTLRWGPWLWAAALALAVPSIGRTARLYMHLRSELEQLLPRSAPSVLAVDELRRRLPSLQYLGVVVAFGSDAELPAAETLLDELAARVRAYPPELVKTVRAGDAVEPRKSSSLATAVMPFNISRRFAAMVISDTGYANSPFSIQSPAAPRE